MAMQALGVVVRSKESIERHEPVVGSRTISCVGVVAQRQTRSQRRRNMFTPIGRSQRSIGRTRAQRIARGPRQRAFVTACLAVLALYAVTGSVAPAYAAKLPTVTSVTPSSGPRTGGTSVTIKGTFFKNVKAVKFGSTNATSFTVKSATSITATSPARPVGTVDVTVTISGGRSSATSPADHFEFTPTAAKLPTVTSVEPSSGPAAGGTLVTIRGTNFKKVITVKFGSTNATSFAVNSATSITAVSPPEVAGRVDVTVTTAKGTSPISANDKFEVTPTITGVSPNEGSPAGGTTVTVTGSGFVVGGSTTELSFGGEPEGVFCRTTTECTVNLPPHIPGESGTVAVTAFVNGIESPESPAAQFHYHGFVLVGPRRTGSGEQELPLPVGESFELRGSVGAPETTECTAFVGASIQSYGATTMEIGVGVEHFTGCLQENWSGELPFSFTVRLGDNGSATIEGPMDVHTGNGCVYEGHGMGGGFALNAPLSIGLGGTFTFVAEEEPGAECPATAPVSMSLETEGFTPYAELVS